MGYSVLSADKDPRTNDLIEVFLRNEDCTVIKCSTATDAIRVIDTQPFDLAILDATLPETDGLTICCRIREKHTYPIILLSDKSSETDKISGLAMGADDYMIKPFHPLELVARVKAQLRRYKQYNIVRTEAKTPTVLSYKDLVLNTEQHSCTIAGAPVTLTPMEFQILELLLVNKGKLISSEELFRRVWQNTYYSKSNNTITVHIRRLREKLNDSVEEQKYIRTIWGVGYMIEAD